MAIVEMKEFRVMQQNGDNIVTVCANAKQAIASLDVAEKDRKSVV